MRDATFTLYALHALGLDWEADDFMQFVVDLERNQDGSLQIMYGIGGERDLTEKTLDHLCGYDHSLPVRIGNGAFSQRQNDVFGAVVDSVYLHTKRRNHMPHDLWPLVEAQVECAAQVWHSPTRASGRRAASPSTTSARSSCAGWRSIAGPGWPRSTATPSSLTRWQKVADEIHEEILAKGVSERGVFRQHYETDALDASLLLMPILRFLPPDDERLRKTVMPISNELTEHGLVLRYKVDETDDGLHGKEGTFAICSFWLVAALSEIGDKERARGAVRADAGAGLAAGSVRRGDRGRDRAASGQLPPGLHPSGADQCRAARDRRRADVVARAAPRPRPVTDAARAPAPRPRPPHACGTAATAPSQMNFGYRAIPPSTTSVFPVM